MIQENVATIFQFFSSFILVYDKKYITLNFKEAVMCNLLTI